MRLLTYEEGTEIRESFLVFPSWSQPFWTWLTGRSLPSQKPVMILGHWEYLCLWGSIFGLGVWSGVRFFQSGHFLLLPIAWLFALSASRVLVSTIVHQCIHHRFGSHVKSMKWVAEIITLLTMTACFRVYRKEHTYEHHKRGIFTTERDPSAQLLIRCGFKRGMSRDRAMRCLIQNAISPRFHFQFLFRRIADNLWNAPWLRAVAALLFWSVTLSQPTYLFIVAYAVPVLFLYQISVLLEFASEHAWLSGHFPAASWGRFCGSPVPKISRSWLKNTIPFTRWLLTMIFYHLIVRLAVLPADLPQHDFHHRYPGTEKWTSAAYARSEEVSYFECWGLHRALAYTFENLERGALWTQISEAA